MTMTWLAVALGGAIGAPLRYLLDRFVTFRTAGVTTGRALPWGLLAVNTLGSALAGVVLAATNGDLRVFLLAGFCGAFTTFSGFAWEADRLWEERRSDFWIAVALMTGACVGAFLLATGFTVVIVK